VIDFSKYVNPFRQPKSHSLGPAIREMIDQNLRKRQTDNQESQYESTRSDTQATNAANFARDTANTAYDTSKGKYDKQMKAILDARAAVQSGHEDTARALIPSILALGGQAEQRPDGTFYFKEGDAPTRGGPDFAGARRDIYGTGGPSVSAPFQVPGFGANGRRNPMDPPSLPGASAAALPPPGAPSAQNPGPTNANPLAGNPPPPAPPDAAGPPPGAAVDGPLTPPPGAVWLPPTPAESAPEAPAGPPPGAPPSSATQAAQSGQPGSEQPIGPNPFKPPGLDDPYTIDPARVRAASKERLQPFLGGVAKAAGTRYRQRIEEINKHVAELGLPPDEAIKVTEKLYAEIFGLARSELAMEGQSGRLEQQRTHQESVQADRARDRGIRRVKGLISTDGLTKTKDKLNVSEGIYDLIKAAGRNPQVASQLIAQLYRMNQSGVMTDKDYDHTSQGVVSILGAVKNFTLDKLLAERGGLNPDTIADMTEFVDIALRNHRKNMGKARDTLYRAYQGAQNEYEKEGIGDEMKAIFPEEYWPDEFKANWDPNSGTVPEHNPEDKEAVMQRMQEQENLGVAPLPRTDRRDPTTGRPIGSRVPMRPARKASNKPVEKMTNAELREEMNKILE